MSFKYKEKTLMIGHGYMQIDSFTIPKNRPCYTLLVHLMCDKYLLLISRYVHRNPMHAEL